MPQAGPTLYALLAIAASAVAAPTMESVNAAVAVPPTSGQFDIASATPTSSVMTSTTDSATPTVVPIRPASNMDTSSRLDSVIDISATPSAPGSASLTLAMPSVTQVVSSIVLDETSSSIQETTQLLETATTTQSESTYSPEFTQSTSEDGESFAFATYADSYSTADPEPTAGDTLPVLALYDESMSSTQTTKALLTSSIRLDFPEHSAPSSVLHLASGFAARSSEAAHPSTTNTGSTLYQPVNADSDTSTPMGVHTRFILGGVFTSFVVLGGVFYICALLRRRRTKHLRRATINGRSGNQEEWPRVLARALTYDKTNTRASTSSSFFDEAPNWHPGAPPAALLPKAAASRSSTAAWLRPSRHFPSLSVSSLRASMLSRPSVFSGVSRSPNTSSSTKSPTGTSRRAPTGGRAVDNSEDYRGSKFSVTSSDFGDCEKHLLALGEVPRPDEALGRTPPEGVMMGSGHGTQRPGGMQTVQEEDQRWTISGNSMEEYMEERDGYVGSAVVQESQWAGAHLPTITFSDYAEHQGRQASQG